MLNKVNEIKKMIKKEITIVEKDSNLIVSINRFNEVDFIKKYSRNRESNNHKKLGKRFCKR